MTTDPSDAATREPGSRVALVTCAQFPDLWDDDHPLRDALRAHGVAVDAVAWDDPAAAWDAYDLAVLRSTWDYPGRVAAFRDWAGTVPRLANPADVVRWNADKHYLRDLAAAGVPVIPTTYVAPGTGWTPDAGGGPVVVKPTVSVGSRDTGRYDPADPAGRDLAAAHVARLGAAGRTAMVQPYLTAVDTAGETAVLCLPDATGRLAVSHAVRKGPQLDGPDLGAAGSTALEDITARTPAAAERDAAARALAAVPGGADRLLYARVDLIPGPDGAPLLVELELIEPSLFLRHAPGAAARFAAAIAARLR